MIFNVRAISSLEKCFLDEEIGSKPEYTHGSALYGERFFYQLAYTCNGNVNIQISVRSDIGAKVRLCTVENVPSLMPAYPDHDDNVLRTAPGLYPDLLRPLPDNGVITVTPGVLSAIWVEVRADETVCAGMHDIDIDFVYGGEILGSAHFCLEVIAFRLPEQSLKFTQWIHLDCLAQYYKVPVFSEEHWRITENFVKTAVDNGINMILTPIFTPPLDTLVGGERPTVQLIGVDYDNDRFSFDFTRFDRFVKMCLGAGIRYFEMAHLFTQWGALHAPKIIARINGKEKRIFGWETDACAPEYTRFLNELIPALRRRCRELGIEKDCVYHISDEPSGDHIDSYMRAKQSVSAVLDGCYVMDALSDYGFYANGVTEHPVVANDHIGRFIENNVKNLWTYYCCGQQNQVSNRFLCMPSSRNRIIGVQLFKYDIAGFLQWGYNFYNNRFSVNAIDPYLCTDAQGFVPSGDAFSVYPGNDGNALETIHLVVFTQALYDLRAMNALAALCGKETVSRLLEQMAGDEITFNSYPRDAGFILNLREEINARLKQLSAEA